MLEVENLDVSWFAFFCFPEQIWMLALWRIWISHWIFLSLYTYTCILWKKINLLIKSSGMSITMENKFEMIKWMMRYWCTSKILQQLIHSFVIFIILIFGYCKFNLFTTLWYIQHVFYIFFPVLSNPSIN